MNAFDEASAKINQRLQRKIKVKQTLKLYHYQLKKRIEEKIHVFQNFSMNERMLIKLQVTRPVSNTFWEILEEPTTSTFRPTWILRPLGALGPFLAFVTARSMLRLR